MTEYDVVAVPFVEAKINSEGKETGDTVQRSMEAVAAEIARVLNGGIQRDAFDVHLPTDKIADGKSYRGRIITIEYPDGKPQETDESNR